MAVFFNMWILKIILLKFIW